MTYWALELSDILMRWLWAVQNVQMNANQERKARAAAESAIEQLKKELEQVSIWLSNCFLRLETDKSKGNVTFQDACWSKNSSASLGL